MGRWVLCVAFAIVACLALKQELWVVASSGCSNHPSTPLHRRTTSDEISQSIDHIPESSPRIHSLMKIRGGKSKSFLSSLVDWFKSVLGIKSKQKNTRYGKKNNDSESKIKVKEPASKGKSPPKKSSETPGQGRLQREIQSFLKSPPHNCKLSVDPKNIRSWEVTLRGVEGTVYAGEDYKLKMVFSKDYPGKPPSVYFLKPVPKHMHVYSNGDICLNLLGRDWRPTMTAESLAVSILSMLSSAKEKTIPQDNAMHADAPPGRQQDNWMYHDDKC